MIQLRFVSSIGYINTWIDWIFDEQLLDIFTLDDGKSSKKSKRLLGTTETADGSGLPAGFRVALASLPELWTEENYENEYNLDAFISTLNQKQ